MVSAAVSRLGGVHRRRPPLVVHFASAHGLLLHTQRLHDVVEQVSRAAHAARAPRGRHMPAGVVCYAWIWSVRVGGHEAAGHFHATEYAVRLGTLHGTVRTDAWIAWTTTARWSAQVDTARTVNGTLHNIIYLSSSHIHAHANNLQVKSIMWLFSIILKCFCIDAFFVCASNVFLHVMLAYICVWASFTYTFERFLCQIFMQHLGCNDEILESTFSLFFVTVTFFENVFFVEVRSPVCVSTYHYI